MLSDNKENIGNGLLSSGIEANASIYAVISFIREHFKEFARIHCNTTTANEKGLTQKLCLFLNFNARQQPFYFHSEFMEDTTSGSSPQVDIGILSYEKDIQILDKIYNREESFFSIEAKRLPTPGTNREREYVVGHQKSNGGMERFKKGIHGANLKYAAIIGYVQKQDFNHWFLKINTWISELIEPHDDSLWTLGDKVQWLENNSNIQCVELFSENTRILNGTKLDKIKLYHFWINLITDIE